MLLSLLMKQEIGVTVLLEHYEGDEYWSARVPAIEGCVIDVKSPEAEEVSTAIIPEIEYFINRDPSLLENLKREPKHVLQEIRFQLNDPSDISK